MNGMSTQDIAGEAASLLRDLVAIPSVNPGFRKDGDPEEWFGERRIGEFTAGWLRRMGLEVALQEVLPGRSNVLAFMKGSQDGRSLVWEAHLDTVQVGGMRVDPFGGEVRDGRLYGRGAVDVKGGLAAMMLALRLLGEHPSRPSTDVYLAAVVDEEYQYRGVSHLIESGLRVNAGVVAEPTGLKIASACKGCVRWRIVVTGRSAHTSRPAEGINAIEVAAALLQRLREELGPRFQARVHPLVGAPTLCCSLIEGGTGVNTVPDRCVLTFDRRLVPGETDNAALEEIRGIAEAFRARTDPRIGISMERPFVHDIPMEVPTQADIVSCARRAARAVLGDDEVVGVPFGSDASKLVKAGIPTIIFGPGNIEQAHTAEEFVEIEQVAQAALTLVEIAQGFGARSPASEIWEHQA